MACSTAVECKPGGKSLTNRPGALDALPCLPQRCCIFPRSTLPKFNLEKLELLLRATLAATRALFAKYCLRQSQGIPTMMLSEFVLVKLGLDECWFRKVATVNA